MDAIYINYIESIQAIVIKLENEKTLFKAPLKDSSQSFLMLFQKMAEYSSEEEEKNLDLQMKKVNTVMRILIRSCCANLIGQFIVNVILPICGKYTKEKASVSLVS